MGKRIAVAPTEPKHVTPLATAGRTIRKRKRNSAAAGTEVAKAVRLTVSANNYWHENDDEDSSSNDTAAMTTPPLRNLSTKHANNSSILLNSSAVINASGAGVDSSVNESPKPVYTLLPSVVNGTVLHDLTQKPWRLGRPIGKGNFGEIFLASDNITVPVTNENAKFVVKIEPHSNGPLFVEIHCLMNTARKSSDQIKPEKEEQKSCRSVKSATPEAHPPSGIPDYIASGSHYFGDARYRFLVLQRFDRDLHSLIKNCRVHQKSVLTLAIQIVNVLESLHDKGYCHNDVKAQNLMISKCMYYKKEAAKSKSRAAATAGATTKVSKYDEHYEEKQQTTDSGNSSEQEANDDDDDDEDFVLKRQIYIDDEEDEDFDDGATSNSNNSNSMDIYETPVNRNRKRRPRNAIVEFSGSNPVRSCRRQKRNSIYEEMVKSHYLRPTKRISYSEFFNEDDVPVKEKAADCKSGSSDDESEEFLPRSLRRAAANKKSSASANASAVAKRLTRRQEKILSASVAGNGHNQKSNANINGNAAVESLVAVEEERIFLIDFGLASKFMDNGIHRPFVMDQRRAHDGTLEFTSRDAHMGAHSRRSDLECLGYNLIFWSQGYLPWKDAATQHQQEKVHRAKEYLMTDVREMLKQIYGKQVPKYLGEFLHHVGQLAYHERPDYARYRRIFEREFQQLGYTIADMRLNSHEIVRTCVRVKEEIENKNDIFEMNKHNGSAWSIMKNLSVGTPFHERTLSNRVSPKNLRSKSDKKSLKKKKFSWAEILSQDPDQIARERAEKEFDREEELSDVQQPTVRRYEGKPTYAILEIQQRLRQNGRQINDEAADIDEDVEEDNDDQEADVEMEECKSQGQGNEEEEEDNDDDDDEDENEDEEADEEVDSTNDDDREEEQENDNDEEVETDATEASEQQQQTSRTRRAHNTRSTKTVSATTRKISSKTTLAEQIRSRGNSGVRRVVTSTTKTTAATRSARSCTTNTAKCSTQSNCKRGSATRCKRKTAASGGGETDIGFANNTAAGELCQHTVRYLHNGNGYGNGHGHGAYGAGGGKLPERRTRRCLIKTDTEVGEELMEQESNSNFSPDVCSLFNVWKKINNESMYYRGSSAAVAAAAATRHCKK